MLSWFMGYGQGNIEMSVSLINNKNNKNTYVLSRIITI